MKAFTLSFALVLAAVSNLQADVIYAPVPIGSSPRTSDYGSSGGGSGFRTFDNFTPSFSANIETISWRGLFFGDISPAAAPSPDVLNWEIAFYADNGGEPGSLLAFESFAAADVASTFRGTGVLNAQNTYNVSFYDYSVTLTNPFTVTSGTEYWLSVLSRSSSVNPSFALLGATGGDDLSYQELLGPDLSVLSAGGVARDRAVILEGTPVPEPSMIVLLGTALGMLPLSRRYRRS